MRDERTQTWHKLFHKNCADWDDRNRLRYLNIPNDQEEIDEDELEAARALILESNKRPPVE